MLHTAIPPIPGSSKPLDPIDLENPLFHNLPIGILILDESGHVRSANPMAEALLGVKAAEMRDRLALRTALDVACRDSSQVHHKALEITLARPDGTPVWLNLRTTPIPGGIAIALENAGPRMQDSATLEAHTRLVEQAHDLELEDLLRASLDEVEKLTFSSASAYFLIDADENEIVLQVSSTRMNAQPFVAGRQPAPIEATCISPDLIRRQYATIQNRHRVTPSADASQDALLTSGHQLFVPVVRDGKVRAIVAVQNKPFLYDEADVRVVERLANLSWKLASLKLARREAEGRADQIRKVASSAPGLVCKIRLSPEGRMSLHPLAPMTDDFFGISAAELAIDVSGLQKLIHPDDLGRQRLAIAASARDLTPYHNRSRITHPTKGLRWIEAWSIPQRDADGGTLWHGFLMDVTAQAEAEAAAARNAARLEESFEQAAIGLVLTSPDLKVMKANQAFCAMLGYSQEEIVGADVLAFTHPEDRRPTVGAGEALTEGRRRSFEKRYLHKDGRVIWAQVDASLVRRDDGQPSHFVTQVLDITKRKQADQERDLTLQVLGILNRTDDVTVAAQQILGAIRAAMNLDAAAVRLTNDGDLAYVAHEGFSEEFVQSERCFRNPSGTDPEFDCICRLVMEGRTDSCKASFTPAGSACIDNSPAMLSIPWQREQRHNPRNRCFHSGYQSVLVIPVRSGDHIVGLLQLNDRRAHVFTPEQINFLEGLAPTIGLALDRKQAAERLAQSQQQLRLTGQAVGAGYWRFNSATKATEWSPALWSLLGLKAGDASPSIETWLSTVHPEDQAHVQQILRRLSETVDDIDFEWRVVHPDKTVHWLLTRCRPEKHSRSSSVFTGITIDITDRKVMEEALRASEERFSRAFQLAPALSLIVRVFDNVILDANQEFCRVTQFTPQDLVGHSLMELGMVSEEQHRPNAERMASEGLLRNVEAALRTKDGRSIDCLLSVQAFELHGEQLLLAMATDITESKRAQAALRENEERFRLLIEHAPAALALFDDDMCYLAASRRWMDDYGLGDQDIIGKSHYEVFPELSEIVKTVHRLALAGETIRASEDRFERADGRVQWLRWEVLPWHRADGSIGGIVIFSEDVTARKSAEAERQVIRAKLDAAMDSTTDAIFISDAEGHFIDFNEAFAKFHKFASKQECSRSFAEYPEFLEVYFPSGKPVPVYQWAVPRALRGETATNTEFGFRRKDTGETWVGSFSFAPIRDESGIIVGTVVVGRDITEQKRAEKALAEVSERFRQVSEAAKEWIWEVDVDGLYTYSSPVVEHLLGYRPDELVGRHHFYDFWPAEVREALMHEAQETIRRKACFNLPNTCLHKDGHPVLIETTAFPILSPEGALVGYRGADRDVTDRESAQAALRESEARFREMFEQSPVAVWEEDLSAVADRFTELRAQGVTDLGRYLDEHPEQVTDLAARVRIVAVNEASLRLLGASSPKELSGGLAEYLTEPSVAAFRQCIIELYNGKTKFETETSHRDSHGKILDLQLRMSVLPGHTRALSRVLVSFADLTAHKAAEAERRELERQLNHLQRLESLGRLASGVSHDMNNVLGAIMAIGSLLQAKYKHDPAILKDAESLLHAAVRGRDLVQGLRDFSRKELQSARRLDLNDLVRHEADLLERTTLKRISIVLDLARDLPVVFGEASGIQNALMNLCVNAMDAMPDKGTLTLSSRDLGQGFVEIAVTDDGEGMSPEVLARALEPFFTTKPIGKGTGLGLSQVYGTVKAHGGSLDIKSKRGQGTRVSMVFPSVQVLVDRTSPEHHALGHPARVLKILLVDDEEMIRSTVLSLLDVLGHKALAASSGIEALRRLDAGLEIDLVILDINMPGLDGVETLARLRIAHPEVKVLFSTGHADDRIPSVLRRFPDIRILKKPFNITDLERALSEWA